MDQSSSCQEPSSILMNQFVLINHDVLPPKPRAQPLQLDPLRLDARYYAGICRQPLVWHTVSAVLQEYDMAGDEPKAKRFALFCRSKQAIHDERSIFKEWQRERNREEYNLGQAYNFSKDFPHWILNNDQNELEFRISRYKAMEMFWTPESRVSMQKRVEAVYHQWTQQQKADARDKPRRQQAEAAHKLKQEATAAQLVQKQLADAAKRKGFMGSVRERARLALQPQQEQAIEPTPTSPPRSSDVTKAQPASAPSTPAPRKNSLSPTATEFKPLPRRNSLSPTAPEFKPAPPKPSLSPTAADFIPAPPKKPLSPTAPAFEPPAPPCTLPYCQSRNVPGIIRSQDQAWIYAAVVFLKLELRLRCLEATAAAPFVEPEGYAELMGDRMEWREQLALMGRVDKGFRERLDGMDVWGLDRYEKELVGRIGRLEKEAVGRKEEEGGSAGKEG